MSPMLKRDPKRLFLRYVDKGDPVALGRVFDLLAPELLALAMHLTRSREAAEDALQETFLAAVESAARFDRGRALEPWLVGILVNRARKARGRGGPGGRARAADTEELERIPDGAAGPGHDAEVREVTDLVEQAIGQLEEPYRSVVAAHVTDGLPAREIAPRLGRAPGTVRVQLHRGLEKLRRSLSGPGGAPRPEFRALVPAGAALAGAEQAARMAAIKAEVLRSAGHVGLEAGGAWSVPPAALGVAATVAVGVTCTWLALRSPAEPEAPIERVVAATPREQIEESVGAPELAEVEARSRPSRREKAETERTEPAASVDAEDRKRKPGAAAPTARPVTADEPETVPFLVEPRVIGGDFAGSLSGAAVRYEAYTVDGELLASGRGPHRRVEPFSIGSFADPFSGPRVMRVRYDHPDALPAFATVTWAEWTRKGNGYATSPLFQLEEVETRLRVKAMTNLEDLGVDLSSIPEDIDLSQLQPLMDSFGFTGEVLLVDLGQDGARILDKQRLASGTQTVSLRSHRGAGTRHVLALSEIEGIAPLLVRTSIDRREVIDMGAPIAQRPYPPYRARVLDPFGEPMAGIEIVAEVPEDQIALSSRSTGKPTSVEGWIFAVPEGEDARAYAGVIDASNPSKSSRTKRRRKSKLTVAGMLDLVPVRPRIEGVSDEEGHVRLVGALAGAHSVRVRSPLDGSWDEASVFDLGSPARGMTIGDAIDLEMRPHVAGLEVERPDGLVERAGSAGESAAELWSSAVVTVKAQLGSSFEGTASTVSDRAARILVPPGTTLLVHVQIGEHAYEVSTTSMGPGEYHRVVPLPVKARPEAEESIKKR